MPEKVLKGIPASPGVATGRVLKITNLLLEINEQLELKTDSHYVLVIPFSTPALLLVIMNAAAVVTEMGGTTSHTAIICRELCIPCVVGVRGALAMLENGMEVKVDGNEGKVYIR